MPAARRRFQDVGAVEFGLVVIGIVDIRLRSYRDEHLPSIRRKCDVAGPVTAAAQTAAAGKVRDMPFFFAAFRSPFT